MPPRVYIIILNYRNWQDTIECLESVFRLRYTNFSVLVVDNDSQNDSLQHLMDWADGWPELAAMPRYRYFTRAELPAAVDGQELPPLSFIQNDRNAGFAGGNNVAIRALAGNEGYIWLLNPDIVIEPDMLAELIRFAGTRPGHSIIGSVLKFHHQRDKIHYYGGGRVRFSSATVSLVTTTEDIPRLDYISGGALLTRTSNFRELGVLPEEYFLYWEETDWCYKARLAGFGMEVCTTAICYDKGGTSIGKGDLAEFFYTRNGLLFVSRYKRGKIAGALFFAGFRLMKRLLSGQWARARGVGKGIAAFLKNTPA
jgi:GT2 family glycosyltransferase